MKKKAKTRINKELKKVLKASYKEIILKFITSIAIRGLLLLLPILYSNAIDWAVKSNFEKAYHFIILSIIFTIMFYISEIVNEIVYYYLYNKIYKKFTKIATVATFKNSIYSLSRFSLGEYTNILNNDVEIITAFFSNGVIRIVQMLEFLFIYGYFFSLDIYIFLITVIVSILMLILFMKTSNKVQVYNKIRKEKLDKKTSTIHEVFLGIKEIKGFNVFFNTNKRVKNDTVDYLKANQKYSNYVLIVQKIVLNMIQMARLGLVFYGIYLMSIGKMEIGTIMLIYTYYQKIVDNFFTLSTISVEFENLKVSLVRTNKILEYSQEKDLTRPFEKNNFVGDIIFEDVLYGNKNDPILNNVSLEIKSNQINAITGKVGSGKTGIFDLLLKLNRQHTGMIKIDGINIDNINEDIYYDLISSVRKNPIFFNLSIKENLLIIENDFEKIVEICKLLNIHEKIISLSNGYDTHILSKEENISNNTKQLIAIARVLLKDSKIMLFDETISILDKESQEIVLKLFERLKNDHTIIIISREQEIMKYADNIIVVDRNKIAEIGTYKTLIKNKGCYYSLYYE